MPPYTSSCLEALQERPKNAQPSLKALTAQFLTPSDLTFDRNHGEFPPLNAGTYRLRIDIPGDVCQHIELGTCRGGGSPVSLKLSLDDVGTKWECSTVLSTLECAGNRRAEMNRPRKTEGIPWGSGVICNSEWQGPFLRSVLLSVGLPDPYEKTGTNCTSRLASWAEGLYIHFESYQQCQEDSTYASSIPLAKLSPDSQIILAHSQNGAPLARSHGYPLRVIIPGVIGARSVKWLESIRLSFAPSTNFYQELDYKRIEPKSLNELNKLMGENEDKEYRRKLLRSIDPLMEMGATSVIANPSEGEALIVHANDNEDFWVHANGYAVGQDGSLVSKVELAIIVSSDLTADVEEIKMVAQDQDLWTPAYRLEQESCARKKSWGWCLWSVKTKVPPECLDAPATTLSLVSRMETESGLKQPMTSTWNLRGIDNRGWSVVSGVRLKSCP